jgi:hypothetical protein
MALAIIDVALGKGTSLAGAVAAQLELEHHAKVVEVGGGDNLLIHNTTSRRSLFQEYEILKGHSFIQEAKWNDL